MASALVVSLQRCRPQENLPFFFCSPRLAGRLSTQQCTHTTTFILAGGALFHPLFQVAFLPLVPFAFRLSSKSLSYAFSVRTNLTLAAAATAAVLLCFSSRRY